MSQPLAKKAQHLLFVDDEIEMRQVFRTYFRKQGYVVTVVASGSEALQTLDDVPIDLIVIDFVLPAMNGLELLDRIRQAHPRLPTVFFTGVGFDELLLAAAKKKGVSGFASKGLPMSQLLMEIHRILDYP
jgi:CheY-like chemotaxis protein